MSRFVRASKYRHTFGQPGKKEYGIDNVKVSNSAWDTNLIAASGRYISVNWNASGGGAFAILPLPSPFAPIPDFPVKLPDIVPLARSHSAPVLDTDWSPHDDALCASGGEDGKLCIWKVDHGVFDNWGGDGWNPIDFDPVARIDASPRKIGQVLWHPTAQHVLASASGEYTVKLWDLGSPENAKAVIGGHGDAIQSVAFNPTGSLLVTTCRDRKLRIFDPRSGSDPVRIVDGHAGVKGARVVWLGENDRIATTGFSRMSDRQLSIWETGSLGNVKTMTIDQSSGVIMPFWSDNGIIFLAGKGDGNIRYYEYESDSLYALDEHKSSDPQRGMCFLPRRALNVPECEIARAFKVVGSYIEPIAFKVPRKSDSFQSDIFPPAPSSEPTLSAGEFFSGKPCSLKLVDLDSGAVTTSQPTAATTPAPAPVSAPAMTKTASASAPVPVPAPAAKQSEPAPAPAPTSTTRAPAPSVEHTPSRASTTDDGGELQALREENATLTQELRDAREKIRNLELQVEGIRANARKAAEALLHG